MRCAENAGGWEVCFEVRPLRLGKMNKKTTKNRLDVNVRCEGQNQFGIGQESGTEDILTCATFLSD